MKLPQLFRCYKLYFFFKFPVKLCWFRVVNDIDSLWKAEDTACRAYNFFPLLTLLSSSWPLHSGLLFVLTWFVFNPTIVSKHFFWFMAKMPNLHWIWVTIDSFLNTLPPDLRRAACCCCLNLRYMSQVFVVVVV